MQYRVRLSMPAMVEVVVDVDAPSQQEAIVAGYDHALAAKPADVKVITLNQQSAMLDTCEPLTDVEPPPAPVSTKPARYSVLTFNTPQDLEAGEPSQSTPFDDYNAAMRMCEELNQTRVAYLRRVMDRLNNKLYEMKNPIGRFVVVVFPTDSAYAKREYKPWNGWILDAKLARREALQLLEAGKVFAVGVLDATDPANLQLKTTLTRNAK
jgi:hypothetical protein